MRRGHPCAPQPGGPKPAYPIVNERGDPLYSALIGRGADGQLQAVIYLNDEPGPPDAIFMIVDWNDADARETLLALDAHFHGGGRA
ncbi:MAG: hypothetical protein V4475_01735 [Pseudomonadota bacterium]